MKTKNPYLICLSVILFSFSANAGTKPDTKSLVNADTTILVDFETGGLYMETSGLRSLNNLCNKINETLRDHAMTSFHLILQPYYCYLDKEQNEFIGVSRAKIVQGEILNCFPTLKNEIFILDNGAMAPKIENPCWINKMGVFPDKPLKDCDAGVKIYVSLSVRKE